MLKIYQSSLSIYIKKLFGGGCRFTPTCSQYCLEAFEKHGFIKGAWLSFKRILKCNPLGRWGEDPVPVKV